MRALRHLVLIAMDNNPEQSQVRVEIHPLKGMDFLRQVGRGVGVSLGLSLLWVLEIIRNAFFRILDRLNVRPRRKRASAFPPGKPRKRPSV